MQDMDKIAEGSVVSREWHGFTIPAWVTGMSSDKYGCANGFPYP